ncbi:hypothetical protein NDA01_30040 [Trichocoleus desertorum AS-A10]|uniref:hypothetical protein n=1 Tax=Trichocoleus desertorum TaxID=1481672 RepID=UPI003299CAF9
MNRAASAFGIRTYSQGELTLDLESDIYQKLQQQSIKFSDLLQQLTDFIRMLESGKQKYNINPYSEKFNRGIHILGGNNFALEFLPRANLALKCSEGQWNAEDPRKQFLRSIELAWEFKTKLNEQEKALLQICPVYLYFQTEFRSALFKRVLFMPRIEGTPLGKTETGFSPEFCQIFNIPSLKEILCQPQFALHRSLDPDPQRQLLKIQSAYLFQHLSQRGIKILSLNQKNILAVSNPTSQQQQYVIIDPTADYCLPISPAYNLLTAQLCRFR